MRPKQPSPNSTYDTLITTQWDSTESTSPPTESSLSVRPNSKGAAIRRLPGRSLGLEGVAVIQAHTPAGGNVLGVDKYFPNIISTSKRAGQEAIRAVGLVLPLAKLSALDLRETIHRGTGLHIAVAAASVSDMTGAVNVDVFTTGDLGGLDIDSLAANAIVMQIG